MNGYELADVENTARRKVWTKKWFGKIILDMDSTVRGVYGSQEGAEKGHNSKKKGQKSYHPLLCFVAENRECLHNWFRAGGAYSANGCVEFLPAAGRYERMFCSPSQTGMVDSSAG